MEIKLTLALPRDQLSVPVVRRILQQSLETLGIEKSTISDIGLALTEACTNVLDHAAGAEEYEVSAGIDGTACVIEVIDRGHGFDGALKGLADAEPHAEDGRGIQLMRALVDSVSFHNKPTVGTVVHMEKQLVFPDGAVIDMLDKPGTEYGPWSVDEHLEDAPEPR
ncbi:MAG: ATP-binding protein [Mycobacteriales bacterium]